MPKFLKAMWAYKYDKCSRCGTTDQKHEARGYCKSCYSHKFLRPKQREYNREYRKTHKQKNYRTELRYAQATRQKTNECEICYKQCKTVFDHDHSTGKFRGWLCQQCNTSLGMVKDKIEILRKMVEYLVKNS